MTKILQNLVNGKWCKTKKYDKILHVLNGNLNHKVPHTSKKELTPFIQSFCLNQKFTDGKKLLSMWHTSNASIDYNKFYIFKHIYKFGSENVIKKFETDLANFH